MHKKKDWTFANGERWVLQADGGFLEDLEELFDGAPAFAVLGDTGDFRFRRVARIVWALTSGFRARVAHLAPLTYADFRDGGYLPEYGSPAWDHMVQEVIEFINSAFAHAIRKGAALLMVARAAATNLGASGLLSPSETNGAGENSSAEATQTQEPSIVMLAHSELTGSSDAMTPG